MMKHFFLSAIAVCALLHGGEMERIESIVEDIAKLRQSYEVCLDKLNECSLSSNGNCTHMLKIQREQKDELQALEAKLKSAESELSVLKKSAAAPVEKPKREECTALKLEVSTLNSEVKRVKASFDNLKKTNETLEEALKEKENVIVECSDKSTLKATPPQCDEQEKRISQYREQIAALQSRNAELEKREEALSEKVVSLERELAIGKAAKHEKIAKAEIAKVAEDEPRYFKASTFRVNKDANIYNAPEGDVLERWEAQTSFTSNMRTQKWVKITGYFINKKWHPNREREMWVKAEDTTIRD